MIFQWIHISLANYVPIMYFIELGDFRALHPALLRLSPGGVFQHVTKHGYVLLQNCSAFYVLRPLD